MLSISLTFDLRQLFVTVFHIINHNKWLVTVLIQGTDTTDKEVGSIFSRLTGTLLTEEAGQFTR
jgi:hypothetical protein